MSSPLKPPPQSLCARWRYPHRRYHPAYRWLCAFLNLGVNLDVYTALDNDDPRGIEALEIDEVRLRFDYLIDVADMDLVTIIPFVEASFYPAKGDARTYNGATANPRLPIATGKTSPTGLAPMPGTNYPTLAWKWAAALPQTLAPLASRAPSPPTVCAGRHHRLAAYQKIHFADGNYRNHVIGLDRTGFTNAELGLTITVPTPLEGIYVAAFGAAHVWLDSKAVTLLSATAG